MRDLTTLQTFLDQAGVDAAVRALRPGCRALVLAVDGSEPGPHDAGTEQLLQQAEASARQALADRPVEELPHVAAWREAYRAFGAKPQRTRNSREALLRRAHRRGPRTRSPLQLAALAPVLLPGAGAQRGGHRTASTGTPQGQVLLPLTASEPT